MNTSIADKIILRQKAFDKSIFKYIKSNSFLMLGAFTLIDFTGTFLWMVRLL